ncbi:MAG: DNA polymerase III subunit gamma/tau C-terminal domain-containing protein, partial [Pseudomonadota bacterium]
LTKQVHQRLTSAFANWFGEQLNVDVAIGVPSSETPAQRTERSADERLERARRSIDEDPNVRALKEAFEAKVDTDSIRAVDGARSSES